MKLSFMCFLVITCISCHITLKMAISRICACEYTISFNTRISCVAHENTMRRTWKHFMFLSVGSFLHYMPVIVILITDTSSASEDEGSLRRQGRITSTPFQSHSNVEPWLNRVIQGSSTSSSASSTSSHPGGKPAAASNTATATAAATVLADLMAHTQLGQ